MARLCSLTVPYLRWLSVFAAAALATVLLLPNLAPAADVSFIATYDFATSIAQGKFYTFDACVAPTCAIFPADGSSMGVNSSDFSVAMEAVISNPVDGEQITWQATKPDGSIVTMYTLTWNQSQNCFIGSQQSYCGSSSVDFAADIVINTCHCFGAIGSWSIALYDAGALLYSSPFTISHNPSSALGIIQYPRRSTFRPNRSFELYVRG